MKKLLILLTAFICFACWNHPVFAQDSDTALRYQAYLQKANDLADQNDFDGARKQALKAIELKPTGAEGWLTLGVIDHVGLNANDDEAFKAFKKYLKLLPNSKKKKKIQIYIGEIENKVIEQRAALKKQQQQAAEEAKWPEGMVLIPAGEFMMGSPDGVGVDSEHPQHKVYLSAFYMDKYPVTNQQFMAFVEATGYKTDAEKNGGGSILEHLDASVWNIGLVQVKSVNWKEPLGDGTGIQDKMNNPVVQIDWNDAQAYVKWTGKRLPTEAEYEKAIRGGTTTEHFWAEPDPHYDYSGPYAWDSYHGWNVTHPVGRKSPNPYGLYDIVGNVMEWCSDWYGEGYYAVSPAKDPQGPDSGTFRVMRGDMTDFNVSIDGVGTSAWREDQYPSSPCYISGFRCAKSVDVPNVEP